MLRNYLKIALRSLSRNKTYSLINLLGLTLGLGCAIFIALFIVDELTFDTFHQNSDQIYRLVEHRNSTEEGTDLLAMVSFKAGSGAQEAFPEIENSLKLVTLGRMALRNEANQNAVYKEFLLAENSFFDFFGFKFQKGDPNTALNEPNTIVLTHDLAQTLFGNDNPMGKVLSTDRNLNFTVRGVLEPLPKNTHLDFSALFSFETTKQFNWYQNVEQTDWNSNFFVSYLKIKEGTTIPKLEQKIDQLISENRTNKDVNYTSTFELQPLTDIHFHSANFENDRNARKSSITYIYIFGLIGFFILAIACINYMNLATARSENYRKEVGIRKVVGAAKKSLIGRFFSETFVLSLISFALALTLVNILMPEFNAFTGKDINLNLIGNAYIFPVFLCLLIFVSLSAGSYPALYLSRFNPASVFKGKIKRGEGNFTLRRSLVVFQFILSTVLIVGTLVAFLQMQYIQEKDLGFNQDQLVVVDINSGKVREGFQTIKDGYSKLSAVKSVSVSSRVPGEWKVLPEVEIQTVGQSQEEGKRAFFLGVDENFLQTFEMEILAGRNFDSNRVGDSTGVLINEKAAELLGIKAPENQNLTIPTIIFDGNQGPVDPVFQVNVIGIVEDFHFQSLHEDIQPMMIGYQNNPLHSIDYFTVRIDKDKTEKTLGELAEILQAVDPNHLFEYHFLDDQLALFYETDTQRSSLFSLAAILAIFIACLGLFGLAAFTAEQRTKEIGIRKVLGASTYNLIGLLSKEFLRLVLIALLLAIPIAWYISSKWLQNFAYSIDMKWWMFLIPGLVALFIALVTVSFQSIKVAFANPIESLRYE